jgi:hypothetical protein
MDKIILILRIGCESVIGFNLVGCVTTNTKNTLLIRDLF